MIRSLIFVTSKCVNILFILQYVIITFILLKFTESIHVQAPVQRIIKLFIYHLSQVNWHQSSVFFCFHFLRIIFANGLVMKILIKIDSYYKFVNYRKLIDFQSANWANHAYLLLLRYARAIFRTRQIFWQRIRPWEHVLPFETIWKNKKSLFEAHPMGVAGTSFDENVPMDQFNWYMQ